MDLIMKIPEFLGETFERLEFWPILGDPKIMVNLQMPR